ncbi:hypothetical protein [Pseudobacteriovorax antillogorgiicola]|uniref:Uncharacterized protein n=1 Tax=Pseudobacteriovorax antillogorgiicola TaxID=1513793 RepID=A0A1Y6B7P1_9BACT|nr:hypothetical protein [Pseudobacteriovorax antillogorgiicola]TCS58585.1 hypothetical protein EDD56_10298 [Pseudobacteriovorax antillogorgiicola]SME97214.1 hypothetical protein SAMN06296036_102345 [Pseudobacteriovorax antillogorgiicola]
MLRFIVATLFLSLFACEENYEKNKPYSAPALPATADVVGNRVLTPTNPNGGDVVGKFEPLDPEESERRKALNVIQPILWGESIAGITMTTAFSEASSILSNSVGTNGFFVFYSEHVAIAWTGAEPNVPFAIVALDGYGGSLSVGGSIGDIKIGSDLSSLLGSYEQNQEFVRTLARTFDGQGAGYDCFALNTCRYLEFNDGFKQLEFRRGVISIDNQNRISLIYSLMDQTYPAPLTGDYVYGQSLGGLTLASNRTTTEQAIGFPVSEDAFFDFYDSLNIGIQWGGDNSPLVIIAQNRFAGDINIGDSITKKIGDSMIDILDTPPDPATVSDAELVETHAPALIQKLERILHNRAADYNCLEPGVDVTPTCKLGIFDDQLVLDLPEGAFLLQRKGTMDLDVVSLTAPRTFEEEETAE